jgi:hypothetical protein
LVLLPHPLEVFDIVLIVIAEQKDGASDRDERSGNALVHKRAYSFRA